MPSNQTNSFPLFSHLGIMIQARIGRVDSLKFRVNHPFIFKIRKGNMDLFIGRVTRF